MKFISIPLMLIAFATMLYMSAGQFAIMAIDVNESKQEASAAIASSSGLTQLSISTQDIASGKVTVINEHEIRYNHKLYDVAGKTQIGNNVVFQVRWDEKEENLISELCDQIQNLFENQSQHNKNSKHVLKNIDKDYLSHSHFISFDGHCPSQVSAHGIMTFDYISASIEIHSPPPQA